MENFKIVWSSRSECGPSREKNEDSIYPKHSGSSLPPFKASVCDGLGGHVSGDVASKIASETLNLEIENLPKWNYLENTITKDYSFDTYLSGIDFVNKLALIAEENNHHPDLSIGWCKVSVTFTSHDQGGVTDDCIKMAKLSEALFIKK